MVPLCTTRPLSPLLLFLAFACRLPFPSTLHPTSGPGKGEGGGGIIDFLQSKKGGGRGKRTEQGGGGGGGEGKEKKTVEGLAAAAAAENEGLRVG